MRSYPAGLPRPLKAIETLKPERRGAGSLRASCRNSGLPVTHERSEAIPPIRTHAAGLLPPAQGRGRNDDSYFKRDDLTARRSRMAARQCAPASNHMPPQHQKWAPKKMGNKKGRPADADLPDFVQTDLA